MDFLLKNVQSFLKDSHANTPTMHDSGVYGKMAKLVFELGIGVLCFSKNRPFQLEHMIRSLESNLLNEFVGNKTVVVLYSSDSRYIDQYKEVFSRHSLVTSILEQDFSLDFCYCLDVVFDKKYQLVMFCVDDLIFTTNVDFSQIRTVFEDTEVFSLHLKLHPGICYSHASTSVANQPTFSIQTTASSNISHMKFRIYEGTGDWRYPFDLCGGIYRIIDVQELIKAAIAEHGDRLTYHPNYFEFYMNESFWKHSVSKTRAFAACMTRPHCCVITVNRVQDVYNVPIYSNADTQNLCTLNSYIVSGGGEDPVGLDLNAYLHDSTVAVHVGALHLIDRLSSLAPPFTTDQILVSVLLPVHNGERYLQASLVSLLDQKGWDTYTAPVVEVLVVNDHSEDRSVEIATNSAHNCPHWMVMRVIHVTSGSGLVAALESGLAEASSNFVARMDADDVCEPDRLWRQFSFLQHRPDIHVLGSQALLLDERDVADGRSGAIRDYSLVRRPVTPALTGWELHFSCALLHPTVMFRKDTVLACGSYRAGCVAEDYDLWHRVLRRYPRGVTSLPDVLLRLRRHSDNKTRMERDLLVAASRRIRWEACDALLHDRCDFDVKPVFDFLQDSSLVATPDDAKSLVRLLDVMLEQFLAFVTSDSQPLNEDEMALLLDSKEKKACKLLLKTVKLFGAEGLETELASLRLKPSDLLRSALLSSYTSMTT